MTSDKDDYSIQLDPETKMHCTLYLFKDVENTGEIRRKVMSGDIACCILKPTYIIDPFQIVIAANKAAINESCSRLITKNKYTEIIFYLSMSKNISKSLRDFGTSENDKKMLIVTIHEGEKQDSLSKMIVDNVKGKRLSLMELKELTDLEVAKRYYKIDNEELNVSCCIDSIISRIACKDFSSK
ncbi:EKC/KEOPS complex subunit TPRKB-like [Vespa velutina]|uniref:EKC/KEOPS complex subunit TPRKB-like n=1 Tax=Vespa velutina TaxID=202808 RepID=UPI001FB38D4D|nr:EKC/KEOPS complex subunit TPRKB-like [Vespa velutina]